MRVIFNDPLFDGGVNMEIALIVVFKVAVTFVFLVVAVMLMIWFERKVISDMQNRVGPDQAGPWGILQSVADGVKLFFKEDLVPEQSRLGVYRLAPLFSIVPAFVTFAVVPVGGVFEGDTPGTISLFRHETFFQLADPPVGVLLVLAMSSIAVYGVMLAGWASGSKYPLLGSVRATAQMVSYEAALGLSVASVVLFSGSLTTHQIVADQAPYQWNLWVAGFIPFVVFVMAATAELNRPPFDLVEAEQELVGGFHTEYSSVRFAMFYLAEFMNVITMSAIIVTLFLGGPSGPILLGPEGIWPPVWFFVKLLAFLFFFVWLRATLPRFRYDQLMDLGWKVLIPVALAWLLILATFQIARDQDWSLAWVLPATIAVLVVAGSVLTRAVQTGRANREHEVLG